VSRARRPALRGRVFSAYSWVPGSLAWTSVPGQPDDAGFPFGTSASIGGRLLFLGGGGCGPGAACPARNFFDGAWFIGIVRVAAKERCRQN